MDLDRNSLQEGLRKSFAVIQGLKLQLAEARERKSEPIAVIGMACRMPGGADTPEGFWDVLSSGADTLRTIPEDRWDWRRFFNPNTEIPGTHYVRHGSFLDQIDHFDPDFFGISGREADNLDPQHRLLLEVSWEALERAGFAPSRLRQSQTGVYVGIGQNDYAQLQMFGGRPEQISAYDGTGASFCFASARLSYILGLQGPNMAVDTACSSSLVALHLACQALRNGECEQALAGGVHLVLSPEVTIYLSRLKALSPDGRSKAFSADADGYGRGEGCGMLVLKRLADAQRNGDRVLALLRGSAINHDGASSGLTVPNGQAQQQLLREALNRAEIRPEEVGWIEAHGTGTSLGDPIEAAALADVFPRERRNGRPLYLSSVKTNIGHLEAASGIAGVIKVILALQHGELPPHLHLGRPNPDINWDRASFRIPTVRTPWQGPDQRIAGVSAFGLGGTNAHIILSESPPEPPSEPAREGWLPLVLSARTPAALTELAVRYLQLLRRSDLPFADIAWTAATGRKHFEYRLAITARSASEAGERLSRAAPPSILPVAQRKIAFLFSGQGSQYCGMGRELLRSVPVFRRAALECAELVRKEAGWSPMSFLEDETADPRIDQTEYTQASLFTLQYALVSMWRAWGIEPDVVLGHSIGEFAAAWSAGILSLEDAVRLVVCRGRLMQRLPTDGAMAAVRMSEAETLSCIADYRGGLWVAAVNGPRAVVLAGRVAELDACLTHLRQAGVPCIRLPVSHAFHTPRMEPMVAAFAEVVNATRFAPAQIDFLPTGLPADGSSSATDVESPRYWLGQILNPVRFAEAAADLAAHKADIILEIGPSGSLLPLARQCAALPEALWLPSLDAEGSTTWNTLGQFYRNGREIVWREVFQKPGRFVPLPTYPFQRRRCWIAVRPSKAAGGTHWRHVSGHPLLGERIPSALAEEIYTCRISASEPAFLRDHRVQGDIVFPAAGFIEMALAAATEHFGTERIRLRDIKFLRSLQLHDAGLSLQTIVTPAGDHCSIKVYSLVDSESAPVRWQEHMSCAAQPMPEGVEIDCYPAGQTGNLLSSVAGAEFYEASRARGIEYGPAFQTLLRLDSFRGGEGAAEFSLGTYVDPAWRIHPVLLDTGLQALAAARPDLSHRTFIPAGIESMDFAPGISSQGRVFCGTEDGAGLDDMMAGLSIADRAGRKFVRLRGIRMRQIGWAAGERVPICTPVWEAAGEPDKGKEVGHWVVLGDDADIGRALAALLAETGVTVSTRLESRGPRGRISGVCYLAAQNTSPLTAELALVQALGAMPESDQPRLMFVTRGAQLVEAGGDIVSPLRAGLWGLGRVADNEFPQLRCACVDLDPVAPDDDCALALLAECTGVGHEHQVAWRSGLRHVLRLRLTSGEHEGSSSPSGALVCARTGDLSSLVFRAVAVPPPPGVGEVRVRVRAAGLNFKDVLHASGKLEIPAESGFGFDAAGVVESVGSGETSLAVGDRVMFTLTPGSIADGVTARAEFCCPIPGRLRFAEAAGIPLAFLTAWHALVNLAHLEAGMRVLIHAAAGGVGQAAIQIARLLGAEVFVTSSPGKQRFLREQGCAHVFDSRSSLFRQRILDATRRQGVDVVLNSLSGNLISAGFDCLRQNGLFIEIGKAGIWTNQEAHKYRPDVRYAPFDLADVARESPARIQEMLREIGTRLASGALQPIRTRAFPARLVIDGFRLMARSRHIGKVAIVMPRVKTAESAGTHLVTGAFGAIGRSLCGYLIAQGVKNIALVTRTYPSERSGFAESLRQQGVRTRVFVADVSDRSAIEEVIRRVAEDFPEKLCAVYHAAGVLEDAAISNQTPESFERVAASKIAGAWNLHQATRELDLERFVLFSSASALVGTPGQSNYAAANAALDALAALRHTQGLPALSINWGPWAGSEGMAARLSDADHHRIKTRGVELLQEGAAWNAMGLLLREGAHQALVMPGNWPHMAEHAGRMSTALKAVPSHPGRGTLEEIRGLSPEQRKSALYRRLQQQVATILGKQDPESIRPSQGFFALGMDSLTSMELRNHLQFELQCALPTTLAFDYGTVETLADYLLQAVPAWAHGTADTETRDDERKLLEQLPEADLAELLARELSGS